MPSQYQKSVKKLDVAFKKWIRLRDCPDGFGRCCSCTRYMLFNESDGGHFINCRWMPTRWREDNVHAQCRSCNRFDEGNAAGYGLFMSDKYGLKHIEFLRALSHEEAHFSVIEMELLTKEYRKRIKEFHGTAFL